MTKLSRLADAAAVVFLLAGLVVLLFGGFMLYAGPLPVSVRSAGRLLFVAAALVAIRHAAHPVDPLHRRLFRGVLPKSDRASVTQLAVASRVAVLVVGYFAVITVGFSADTVGFTVSPEAFVDLPARFDAGWYATIALDGYSFQGRFDRQQNLAFFPAFPLLARALGYPLGAFVPGIPMQRRLARVLWAGVFISIAAFAWAARYLWRLARDMIGEARAADAVLLLAAYPFALFFSTAYTESLFLLGTVAVFYHFRRNELARASAWGLLVGLTRPNGCLMSVALAVLTLETLRGRRITSWLAAATPGFGMLMYAAYMKHLTGAWFGWARLQGTWGRSFEGLGPVERAYGWIVSDGLLHVVENLPFDAMNSLGLIFALLMLWPVFRRLGLASLVLVLVNVVPPMLSGGVLSMGRMTATIFPLFLALAAIAPPRTVGALVSAFALGQGLAIVLFFTWRPLF